MNHHPTDAKGKQVSYIDRHAAMMSLLRGSRGSARAVFVARVGVVRPVARRGFLGLVALLVSVLGLLTVTAPALGAWVGHEYLGQLTEVPLGAAASGSFESPGGLVVDSDNNVWVADRGRNVIDEFDSADIFVSQLTGEGKFGSSSQFPNQIKSIAVAPSSGDLYVAESGKDVIDVFEPSGTFKEAWNGSTTPNKKFGKGKENSSEEVSVAIDQSTGDVYVASSAYDVIDEFNAAGVYLTQMTGFEVKGAVESFSDEDNIGEQDVESIAAAGGKLYVLSHVKETIVGGNKVPGYPVIAELGSAGETVGVISGIDTQSSGYSFAAVSRIGSGGHFAAPGLAVDSAGNVYVDGGTRDIVEEFDAAGDYVGKITGAATPAGSFLENPGGIAVNSSGDVYVTDYDPEGVSYGTGTGVVDIFGPGVVQHTLTVTTATPGFTENTSEEYARTKRRRI